MRIQRLALYGLVILALCLPHPAAAADCAAPGAYTVQRGDTLAAIARRFGTTVGALTSLNHINNPNHIVAGQRLALPPGADCAADPNSNSNSVHIVQRGETLARIAARYGVSVSAIAAANNIGNPSRIYAGQRLIIPGASAVPTPPPSIPGLSLSPSLPEQGRALWLTYAAPEQDVISGALGPWPVLFFRDGGKFVGLVGVYALADPGAYTLSLNLTDSAGNTTTRTQLVTVADGGYRRESLTLAPDKAQLLDPALTIPERERVAAAIAPVTPTRHWSGAFQLPAAGRITSAFGTRRSYNGGPYSSFHAGVDFSYSGGLDIHAPAPGMVVLAEPLTVRGNATIVDHGWGVYSGFWHQSEIQVKAGDRVEAGQVIGQIGATGLVTGPHLHWEIFVNGVQVDPLQWTRQALP